MRIELSVYGGAILVFLAGTIGCQREDLPPAPPDLEEVRPEVKPEADPPATPAVAADDPNKLHTQTYTVPPDFPSMAAGGAGGAPADPFKAPAGGLRSPGGRNTGKEVLQSYGITFPETAGAEYDPETNELTVTATADQLDLVDAVMESIQKGMEKMINVRIEIYQLPARLALEMEQATEAEDNHESAWKTVQDLLETGGARFVTSAHIQVRSGQRASVEAVQERVYLSTYDWANKEKRERMVPQFDTRKVGTILQVDPVLGPDDATIDLHIDLEHHTGPPSEKAESVRFPNSEQAVDVSTPEFHVKRLTTGLTLMKGQVKLLGAWRPTGNPDSDQADEMQLVFLKAEIQPAFLVRRIR